MSHSGGSGSSLPYRRKIISGGSGSSLPYRRKIIFTHDKDIYLQVDYVALRFENPIFTTSCTTLVVVLIQRTRIFHHKLARKVVQ